MSGDPQTTMAKTAVLRPDGYGDRRRSHGTDRTFVAAVLTCGPKGLLSRNEPMSRNEPNRGCRGDFVRCCATDVCPSAGQNPESFFSAKAGVWSVRWTRFSKKSLKKGSGISFFGLSGVLSFLSCKCVFYENSLPNGNRFPNGQEPLVRLSVGDILRNHTRLNDATLALLCHFFGN